MMNDREWGVSKRDAPLKQITSDDVLRFLSENGILDISKVTDKMIDMQRKEIIKQHPYRIWLGNDGRYYTHIPKPEGRLLRRRNTLKELEDCIVANYEEEHSDSLIKDVYKEWIDKKYSREEITNNTKNRYDRVFEVYCSSIANDPIDSVKPYELEEFLLNQLHEHHMTAKEFANLKTVIKGVFILARKKGLIDFSITELINELVVGRRAYRKVKKTEDQLVFSDDEIGKIADYYRDSKMNIKDYGIMLAFVTGMRPGELSALKWLDIDHNRIHVNRTEIREEVNGKYAYYVRDFPKTEAGDRIVTVPSSYSWILDGLRRMTPFATFVFEEKGKRVKSCMLDRRLRTICRKTGVTEKSLNKIRKTYATMLMDKRVDNSIVTAVMGHTDIETTIRYYYKKRSDSQQIVDALEASFPSDLFGMPKQ